MVVAIPTLASWTKQLWFRPDDGTGEATSDMTSKLRSKRLLGSFILFTEPQLLYVRIYRSHKQK